MIYGYYESDVYAWKVTFSDKEEDDIDPIVVTVASKTPIKAIELAYQVLLEAWKKDIIPYHIIKLERLVNLHASEF